MSKSEKKVPTLSKQPTKAENGQTMSSSSSSPLPTITTTNRNGSGNDNLVVSLTKNHDSNNCGRQEQQRQGVDDDDQDHHHNKDDVVQQNDGQPKTKKLKLQLRETVDNDGCMYDLCQRLLFSPRKSSQSSSSSSTDSDNDNDEEAQDDDNDDKYRRISTITTTIPHSLLYETCTDESSHQQQKQSQPKPPPRRRRRIQLKNNVHTLRELFNVHGFRTSIISSPRIGLSIYKDSFVTTATSCMSSDGDGRVLHDGRFYLVSMFGLHEQQIQLEEVYKSRIKDIYCLWLFFQRITEVMTSLPPFSSKSSSFSHQDDNDRRLRTFMESLQKQCYDILVGNSSSSSSSKNNAMMDNNEGYDTPKLSSSNASKYVTELIDMVVIATNKANQQQHIIRKEQLRREYDRIHIHNSTLSNALLTKFISAHNNDLIITDVYFKHCHNNPNHKQYERITIYLYDQSIDQYAKPKSQDFIFMPCIHILMNYGIHYLVEQYMLKTFYQQLLHVGGYYISKEMKSKLHTPLLQLFTSGIISNTSDGTNPNLTLPYQL